MQNESCDWQSASPANCETGSLSGPCAYILIMDEINFDLPLAGFPLHYDLVLQSFDNERP